VALSGKERRPSIATMQGTNYRLNIQEGTEDARQQPRQQPTSKEPPVILLKV